MGGRGVIVSQGHWGFLGHPVQGDGLRADAEQHVGKLDLAGHGTGAEAGTGSGEGGVCPLTITGHPEKRGLEVATWVSWTPAWPSPNCPKDKDAPDTVMPLGWGVCGVSPQHCSRDVLLFPSSLLKGETA